MNSESVAIDFCVISSDLLDQSMIKICHCLAQLTEDQIWWRPEPGLNSIGNLCLHVCGNLRQWGIVPLTGTEDTRQREEEFSKEIRMSTTELLRVLDSTVLESKKNWLNVGEAKLLERRTIQGFEVSLMQAISHTSTHFVGHTHQIIMLTRMQLGDGYQYQWTAESDRGQLPI
jgi:uncharacterized damage-inducible protein DinB